MRKTLILFLLLAGAVCFSAAGEVQVEVDLSSYNVFLTIKNDENKTDLGDLSKWLYLNETLGNIVFKSTGNKNVKAEIQLDFNLMSPLMSISKAFVKFRFPDFRAVVGKTRLSWGEGVMFNAGDVLFGSQDLDVTTATTATEFRIDTAPLASIYLPLGRFDFIEAVVIAPQLDPDIVMAALIGPALTKMIPGLGGGGTSSGSPYSVFDAIQKTAVGVRAAFKPFGIKNELGYLFDGGESTKGAHKPYLSFQGNLVVDYHVSAATSFDQNSLSSQPTSEKFFEEFTNNLKDNSTISFGLFHMQDFGDDNDMSATFRLEGLVKPMGLWEEDTDGLDPGKNYGLMLYPEIIFTPGENVATMLRVVVSPIDQSAQFTAGLTWKVFQGFTLLNFVMVQAGDDDDIYSWNNDGALTGVCGVQYLY